MKTRVVTALIFFTVVITVLAGIHFYLWARLVRDTQLPLPWRRLVGSTVLALGIGLVVGMFLQRLLPLTVARIAIFPLYVWMGVMLLLLVLLASGDLVRTSWRLGSFLGGLQPWDPQRRLFLSRLLGGGATVAAFGVGALSSRSALALAKVTTQRLNVTLSRLPQQFDGFRIVQLSDLHIGPVLGRDWLEGVVRRVNALQPDLVAITGDLIDGSVTSLTGEIAPLAQLHAKHGVFFCTGNHEYYSGAPRWCEALPQLGIRVLRNERVPIGQGDAIAFDLAGIDDFNGRGMAPGHGPDLPAALAGRDADRELILLAHQPRAVFEASELGVGLQLSGHTHGGQIWPMHYLVRLQQPYLAGLVRHGHTQLYVSQGTGFWGPPMRLGTRSEISEIVLRAK